MGLRHPVVLFGNDFREVVPAPCPALSYKSENAKVNALLNVRHTSTVKGDF